MSNTIKKDFNSSLKFVYSENNSISVIFHDNDLLMGVVGEFNRNLKELERIILSIFFSNNIVKPTATARKVFPVPAGPADIIISLCLNALTYSFCFLISM